MTYKCWKWREISDDSAGGVINNIWITTFTSLSVCTHLLVPFLSHVKQTWSSVSNKCKSTVLCRICTHSVSLSAIIIIINSLYYSSDNRSVAARHQCSPGQIDRFICFILAAKRRWLPVYWGRQLKKVVNFFEENGAYGWPGWRIFLTWKWPGSFTALALQPLNLTSIMITNSHSWCSKYYTFVMSVPLRNNLLTSTLPVP